jgi:AAA+ superfamily predicted ATPase
MFSKYARNQIRDQNTCRIAAQLLNDKHLVWSYDFEVIRNDLAEMLRVESEQPKPRIDFVNLANKLLEDEFDLTKG